MRYLCLIYEDEKTNMNMFEQEMGQIMAAYEAYTTELQESGNMLGGEAPEH